ncbi:MAG: hypothetical protein WDN49_07245 [Acetobacteraceae bacterium]
MADAICRSPLAMSGRRSSSCEGTPVGTTGAANGASSLFRDRKAARIGVHKHGDRVLEHGAVGEKVGLQRLRRRQLALRARHVERRGDLPLKAEHRDLDGLLVVDDRRAVDGILRIEPRSAM